MNAKGGGDDQLETVISGICKKDTNHSLTLTFLLIALRERAYRASFSILSWLVEQHLLHFLFGNMPRNSVCELPQEMCKSLPKYL